MGGGVLVFFVGYRLADLFRKPLVAASFSRPDRVKIDRPLVIGAALFGVGWGLSGFCPGPAIADLGLVPGDVISTIYHALGIPPDLAYVAEKRPVYVTADGKGKPALAVFDKG